MEKEREEKGGHYLLVVTVCAEVAVECVHLLPLLDTHSLGSGQCGLFHLAVRIQLCKLSCGSESKLLLEKT